MWIFDALRMMRTMSLRDAEEPEEIVAKTELPGLYWVRNYYLRTSRHSRIVLPSPGQGTFTAVYHGSDFAESAHNGYEVYGIHLGQVDVLTFLATDGRRMSGHFVDCREGSPTLHQTASLEFGGDPDRALVIERGIAHIFDNLTGMVTLNQMRIYMDFKNPDFDPNIDVLNVARGTSPELFPVVRVNRIWSPTWLCRLALKVQRMQLRRGIKGSHPFRFIAGGKKFTLTPKQGVGALAPYDYTSPTETAAATAGETVAETIGGGARL
jgi:hypothetical protein